MKLFNTLTRTIDEFEPQHVPQVTVYTCGPTVYDYAHIGHWFTYIRWDMLLRTLRIAGYEPTWVMNITDVGHLVSDGDEGEDKLEKGAKREGKSAWEVAEFYTADFIAEMGLLNIDQPTHLTKATEHIPEQIALIQTLEDKGFTYLIDDGVYYDTGKFPSYANFAKLDLEEQQAGARVTYNHQKRNASDFALWKFSPSDQKRDMEWPSPWGTGFPGWHIECSAMSMKYLGETIDIHTGGIDHIPVHHSNEIAQSEAATGKPFAKYWLHSNHVLIDNEKISKSLGNSIRLKDITAKGYDLEVLRLHVLESNYRSQSKFSWLSLDAANNRLNDIYAWADLWHQTSNESISDDLRTMLTATKADMTKALTNDLNTAAALSSLAALITYMSNISIPSLDTTDATDFLPFVERALGLKISHRPDITMEQKQAIQQRDTARNNKEWEVSDELRDALLIQGIGLRDTSYGAYWYRVPKT